MLWFIFKIYGMMRWISGVIFFLRVIILLFNFLFFYKMGCESWDNNFNCRFVREEDLMMILIYD